MHIQSIAFAATLCILLSGCGSPSADEPGGRLPGAFVATTTATTTPISGTPTNLVPVVQPEPEAIVPGRTTDAYWHDEERHGDQLLSHPSI